MDAATNPKTKYRTRPSTREDSTRWWRGRQRRICPGSPLKRKHQSESGRTCSNYGIFLYGTEFFCGRRFDRARGSGRRSVRRHRAWGRTESVEARNSSWKSHLGRLAEQERGVGQFLQGLSCRLNPFQTLFRGTKTPPSPPPTRSRLFLETSEASNEIWRSL